MYIDCTQLIHSLYDRSAMLADGRSFHDTCGRRSTCDRGGMAHGEFKDLLKQSGFRAFLLTQFLGAFNDSVCQSVTILHVAEARGGAYVPLVPALFVLPSLLFSGYSGHLADRVSKRKVLIGVKIFELFI